MKGGWVYVSDDELAEAVECDCELCGLIVVEDRVEPPDRVGYLPGRPPRKEAAGEVQ